MSERFQGPHTPGCIAGDIDGECPCEQGDNLSNIERRQEAVDALLGVLNDIGGGQRDNYNVSYEAAGKAVDAVMRALDTQGAVKNLDAIEADLCVDEREIEDPALVKIACAYNDGVKAALAAVRGQ